MQPRRLDEKTNWPKLFDSAPLMVLPKILLDYIWLDYLDIIHHYGPMGSDQFPNLSDLQTLFLVFDFDQSARIAAWNDLTIDFLASE